MKIHHVLEGWENYTGIQMPRVTGVGNARFLREAKELEKRWESRHSGLLEQFHDERTRRITRVLLESQRLMNEQKRPETLQEAYEQTEEFFTLEFFTLE